MKLQFLGATDTVTGSKYLLHSGEHHVLVDCGLFQGYKALRLRNWDALPEPPRAIDAVVLTHAHLDHSGYLPLLVRQGFRGPIWCTAETRELCEILLLDSAHLLEEEAEWLGRKQLSKHHPPLPLYTVEDAQACLKQFRAVAYGDDFSPVAGLRGTMHPSGHMPGSAFVRLADGERSILFSGDIGRPNDLVLKPPVTLPGADYLVVESTYGDRTHPTTDALADLAAIIERTAARRGVLVIPAFAVGRAQTLLFALSQLKRRRAIPDIPIYLNSPMASSACAVYGRHPKSLRLDAEQRQAMAHVAHIVHTPDESRALNARKGPMIIIAGSGMATGGRVVHHLKAFAPDPRNTILFAGYQSGGTRGAAMLGGAATIRIHGEDIPVRAEVAALGALSAHADATEILAWLSHFKQPPRRTFITHGEPPAADAMRVRIERGLHWPCHMPYYLETVELS